jgi:hypothetical protein
MSSQARSLRISNIHINVHSFTGRDDAKTACNILTWIVGGAFQDQTEFSAGTGQCPQEAWRNKEFHLTAESESLRTNFDIPPVASVAGREAALLRRLLHCVPSMFDS